MQPIPAAKFWFLWVGLVHVVFAYFAVLHPEYLRSGAYTWATSIIPFTGWAVASLVAAGFLLVSHVRGNIHLGFVGCGLTIPIQLAFGLSIMVLTFSDPPVVSAVIGAFQWWTMAVVNVLFLWAVIDGRPLLQSKEQ